MAQSPPLLQLSSVWLTFGGTPLLEGAELTVSAGERVCLVGRNGSGKSTLLRIAAGLIEPDRGERFVQPGAAVRYLPQEPDLAGHATTLAYVEGGLGPTDDPHQARYLLQQLGLDGTEDPAHLSGGELRRAALARVLAPAPDILLLDEPTNHLDLPAIEWLEARLAAQRGALVLISHDRRFLENLSRTTVWLDRGSTRRIDIGFGALRGLARRAAGRGGGGAAQARPQDRARGALGALRRHRAAQAQRAAHGGPAEPCARRGASIARTAGKAVIDATEARASGTLVIEAKGIAKAFDERPIVAGFLRPHPARRSHRHRRAQRQRQDHARQPAHRRARARQRHGPARRQPGDGDPRPAPRKPRPRLDPERGADRRARRYRDGRRQSRHVVGYMKDFLFAPEQARTPLRVLSGGERGRLMLARALAKPSNLLVLDEPTNDLDLETLDVLEEMLGDYAGTVILISHDRDFLDRTVDAVVVPEGEGRWVEYAGGYTDMLAQRGADLAGSAGAEGQAAAPVRKQDGRARARDDGGQAQAELPRKARARHAAEARSRRCRRASASCSASSTTPASTPAIRTAFTETSAGPRRPQAELAAAEQKWLELEILREEIEGG